MSFSLHTGMNGEYAYNLVERRPEKPLFILFDEITALHIRACI
jgi:hypothetical protein